MKPPPPSPAGLPWVRLRSAISGSQLYKRMIGEVDPKARPGDIVAVFDKTDAPYGAALYNPKSVLALRLLQRGLTGFSLDSFFADRLARAVDFRRKALRLDEVSEAYRLVHDNGDGLPGLIIDRYGDYLVLEFYSLGMFKQADRIEAALKAHFANARFIRRASDHTQSMEGFRLGPIKPCKARVREHGVLFEVEPSGGYKTGFFCDQRENRLALAGLARDKRVLDLCGYTGGFGLYAMKMGQAAEATSVELDAEASALAKKNANVNGVKLNTVCSDAFPYLRQMAANKETYDIVVLDPYKLIASREGYAEGRNKYMDLNRLAFGMLREGGILLTCSCSGLLPWAEFQQIVRTAAGSAGRRAQIFRKSGAGPDHPFAVDSPEGEYLKAIWCRVY